MRKADAVYFSHGQEAFLGQYQPLVDEVSSLNAGLEGVAALPCTALRSSSAVGPIATRLSMRR